MSDKPEPTDKPIPDSPPIVNAGTADQEATRIDEQPHVGIDNLPATVLPSYPPAPADKFGHNVECSPAGPGKPIDGSAAVNTYTPEEVQKQEFEAGAQDWQSLVATKIEEVKVPKVVPDQGKPEAEGV